MKLEHTVYFILLYTSCLFNVQLFGKHEPSSQERPNILWITCEDISPYLGCYGFDQAHTPNLDQFSERGIRFLNAYANAPVCAVARSTILTGMYASTIGTHHMRSRTILPDYIPAYPRILKEAGYYCSNNSKKDYNSNLEFDPTLWDESSAEAHYRNRNPGQPFFSVFNITITHESQLHPDRIQYYTEQKLIPLRPRIEPKEIDLPPYHPDLPEIREDWARLHDLITLMDSKVGELLRELEKEGEEENTIIFFYSDHGGQLSRSKRFIYNVGTQVPMMVYLPPKWQHLSQIQPGGVSTELVSFVDLPKTVISITDCPIPSLMQGRIFLGPQREEPPMYVYFTRDRMGERYDFSRAVTHGRYYFIRHFMPHRPMGRDSRYGYQVQKNWQVWEAYYDQGLCNEIQARFYQSKPVVELYDTKTDPWHVNDLSSSPEYQDILQNLSDELDQWMVENRDLGLIPEPMFHELTNTKKKNMTIYEFGQSAEYPVSQILEVAKQSATGNQGMTEKYLDYVRHDNPVIRYWGAYGLFLTKPAASVFVENLEHMAMSDEYTANRIMAAQALALNGRPETCFQILMNEIKLTSSSYVFLFALNALQYSKTDRFLTLQDWENFSEKPFSEKDMEAKLGYPNRVITDAISLWPGGRIVD